MHSWGQPGSLPGEFRVPHGIWVTEDDRVLVADRENGRVQVFGRDGTFVDEWTDFYRPTNIFVDRHGSIFVSDLIPRISVFDRDGRLVDRLRPYHNNAHGVWNDKSGSIFLAATDGSCVEKFVRQT
jgi:peptidylglycine monooxygenase